MSTTASGATSTMTITDALAEFDILEDRVNKAQQFILEHLTRPSKEVDPLASDGGSEKAIDSKRQSIRDMTKRMIKIRTAVQASNLTTEIEIEGEKMTAAEWLIYRQNIAPIVNRHLHSMSSKIQMDRESIRRRGDNPDSLTVGLSEMKLSEDIDRHSLIVGRLNAALTRSNAVTTITVPN